MLNQMGAGFVLKAYDQATPILRHVGRGFLNLRKQARQSFYGMNAALSNTAAGFMAVQAGLGLINMAKAASDAAGEFQQTLVSVGQVARATSEEMAGLRIAAIDAALVTKFSPKEAAEGLQTLAAMGWRAKEATEILVPVLELATGSLGQLGVAGAADAVSGAIKAMGYELKDAGKVTDQLLKITQMTNFQARDFEVSLGRAGSTAKLYGQSLEDALIQIGLLRNMNIEASVASTSMREAFRRLATDERAQRFVGEYVDIFDKQTGAIRPLIDVMSELGGKTANLNDKERMRLITIGFGVRGMAAYNAILNATYTVMKDGNPIILKGQDAINAMRYELSVAGETLTDVQQSSLAMTLGVSDLNEVLKTSVGVSRQFRDALLDTYAGQKQLVTGAWQTLLVVLGEEFAVALKPAAKALYELITAVALFVRSMSPEAKQMIFKFVGVLASLLVLGGGLMLLSGIFNMLGGSVIGFVFSIGKVLLFGAPILMLLTGLGIGFTSLAGAFKTVGDKGLSLEAIMRNVRLGLSGMMSILAGEDFSEDLKRQFEKAENQGVVKFLNKFQTWLERIRTFWTGLKTGFGKGIGMLSESSAFKRLQDKLKGIIGIFTGPDAENSPEILEKWKKRGEDAGVSLARLGETVAGVVKKVIDLGGAFAEFVATITADDIKRGIGDFVGAFRILGNILLGIKTAFMAIYGVIKLVVVTLAEFGINMVDLYVPSKDRPLTRPKMFTAKGWNWSQGAGKELWSTLKAPGERVIEQHRGDMEFAVRERQRQLISAFEARKKGIEYWMATSAEEYHAGGKNKGRKAWSELSPEMRQQLTSELQKVNKTLEMLLRKKGDIYLNNTKVGEQVAQSPAMTGEDSLDDAAVAVP